MNSEINSSETAHTHIILDFWSPDCGDEAVYYTNISNSGDYTQLPQSLARNLFFSRRNPKACFFDVDLTKTLLTGYATAMNSVFSFERRKFFFTKGPAEFDV